MGLHQRLIQYGLFPLSLWRSGDGAQSRHLREFERTQYLSLDELRSLQWDRLNRLLEHAYRTCPFYRERFDEAGLRPSDFRCLEDLKALPPLEKSDIQAHRDRLVANDWPRDDLIANQTGGSTGAPISFFLSRDRKCSRAAATIRHNRWAGWNIGDKVACIWGAPRDRPPDGWRSRLRNALLERQLFLDTGHLTESNMAQFHASLKQYRPKIILAYARSAVLYARFVRAIGLTSYQPQAVVTSAEVLEADDRRLIEEVFGCPVFNRYGCREFSVVASECEARQGLHTMAEGLYVEIEAAPKSSPESAGEPLGAILVTDLLNHAMPLIRYRIGDMGTWAEGECPCGRSLPRLRTVAGRVTDFLVGSDGRLVSGVFLATYVVAKRPSLGQVQIHQDEPGKVLFLVKPGSSFDSSEDPEYLAAATREHLGDSTDVSWRLVDTLTALPSGKFLFCRSSVRPRFLHGGRDAEAIGAES